MKTKAAVSNMEDHLRYRVPQSHWEGHRSPESQGKSRTALGIGKRHAGGAFASLELLFVHKRYFLSPRTADCKWRAAVIVQCTPVGVMRGKEWDFKEVRAAAHGRSGDRLALGQQEGQGALGSTKLGRLFWDLAVKHAWRWPGGAEARHQQHCAEAAKVLCRVLPGFDYAQGVQTGHEHVGTAE